MYGGNPYGSGYYAQSYGSVADLLLMVLRKATTTFIAGFLRTTRRIP